MNKVEIDITGGKGLDEVIETLTKVKELIPQARVSVVTGSHSYYDGSSDPYEKIVVEERKGETR